MSGCHLPLDVLPGLTSSCFVLVCGNFERIVIFQLAFTKLYMYYIHQEHCANKLQPVLPTVISMFRTGIFMAIQDNARRDKTMQGVTLRQPGEIDTKGVPWL